MEIVSHPPPWSSPDRNAGHPPTHRYRRLAVLGLLCATVWCWPGTAGRAAEAVPAGMEPGTLGGLSLEELGKIKITSVSKRPETTREAPATVLVLEQRDIKLRGYKNLADVFRDLPGMETAPYYFSEIGTQVPVRGVVGNNKLVILVNGMRVNPPGGENFPLRSDFSVGDAERIEVIYGPGSTLYGQDAIGAVVNVITRKPQRQFEGQVGADGGVNATRDAWASLGTTFGPEGRNSFTAHASYHDADLTRVDREYGKWWQDYRALAAPRGAGDPPTRQDFGLNASARLEIGDGSLQVWHRQSERSSGEGGYSVLGYLPEARWGDHSTVAEGRYRFNLGSDVKLDTILTYNTYEIAPSTRYVFPASPTNWFLNDFKYGTGQGYGFEETVQADLTDSLSLVGGFSFGHFDIIPKSTVPGGANPDGDVVAQGGNFVYTDADGVVHGIPRVVRSLYETYAGYVELGWEFAPRWKAIAGTRVTKDTRFDDIPVTPRAALIWQTTDELTTKYIFTRAYVAPAPYFGFATYDNGTLLATSNPNLKPETATSHELNFTYTHQKFTLGLSGYYGQQENLIIISDRATPQNALGTVTLPDSSKRTLVQSANGGSSRNYGLDLFGRAALGDFTPWFSYSYTDFEQRTGGMMSGLPGISRHNGRVGTTWAITSRLHLTPSLVIRSTPENVLPGALGRELTTPWEINCHLLYQPRKYLDLFADFRNLTNNKNALGGIQGTAYPQETFNCVFGVRITF